MPKKIRQQYYYNVNTCISFPLVATALDKCVFSSHIVLVHVFGTLEEIKEIQMELYWFKDLSLNIEISSILDAILSPLLFFCFHYSQA